MFEFMHRIKATPGRKFSEADMAQYQRTKNEFLPLDSDDATQALARDLMQRREDCIRLVLQGRMKLSEWPLEDTQLAQCKTCKGFTMLFIPPPGRREAGLWELLDAVHNYSWACDTCSGEAGNAPSPH